MSDAYQGYIGNQGPFGLQYDSGNGPQSNGAQGNQLLFQQLVQGYQGNQGYVASPQGNQSVVYTADSQGNQGIAYSDAQGNQQTVYALSYQGFQANGGLLVGSVNGIQGNSQYYPQGGLLVGGQPATSTPWHDTSTGGLLIGGNTITASAESYTGSAKIGGTSNAVFNIVGITCDLTHCGCVVMDFEPVGGLSIGGQTTVVKQRIGQGGLSIGGKSIIASGVLGYGSLNWLLPLGDTTDDPKEWIQDLETAGINLYQAPGVFCLPSSKFVANDLSSCMIEKDSIKAGQSFSLSFWCRANNRFKQRALFARGFYDSATGGNWSVKISLGHYGQIVLTLKDSGGKQYETISRTLMAEHLWQHIAISHDMQTVSLYINGVFQRSLTTLNPLPVSNGNSIGVFENSSWPDCWLQEFRCYNDAKPVDYWVAESRNFCDYDDFLSVGDPVQAGYQFN